MGAVSSSLTKSDADVTAKSTPHAGIKSSVDPPHLLALPVELLVSILSSCDASDILNMSMTCRYLLEVSVRTSTSLFAIPLTYHTIGSRALLHY